MENFGWLNVLQNQGRKVYSQGGQDGYLQFIFRNIGTTNKVSVEFGFNTTTLTGGDGANTARLVIEDGWISILLDKDYDEPNINLHKEWLTPANIGDVFRRYNVPEEVDYVSMDVDSIELWLFESLIDSGFRPRVVSCEYNSNFPIDISVTNKPNAVWRGDGSFGSSFRALYLLGKSKGYNAVCVEPGLDIFFIRNDIVPDEFGILHFAPFCGHGSHATPSRESLAWMIQYPSLEPLQKDQIPWTHLA
jgi:hypothetical protein